MSGDTSIPSPRLLVQLSQRDNQPSPFTVFFLTYQRRRDKAPCLNHLSMRFVPPKLSALLDIAPSTTAYMVFVVVVVVVLQEVLFQNDVNGLCARSCSEPRHRTRTVKYNTDISPSSRSMKLVIMCGITRHRRSSSSSFNISSRFLFVFHSRNNGIEPVYGSIHNHSLHRCRAFCYVW